jgi:5-methylcytosine-specific restriction endonuclease McrA
VFARDKGYCRYCDADLLANFSVYFSAQVDHVVAVVAQGSDDLSNLVLACPTCNQALSRASHLRTEEARYKFVAEKREKETAGYLEWKEELR